MAKKHKAKKRKVSGLSLNTNSPVVKILSVAAGFFVGDGINAAIDTGVAKIVPVSSETSVTATMVGEIGLGGLLLLSKSKGKGTLSMVKTLGGGLLVGAGLRRAAKKFGVIKGYQSTPVIAGKRVRGYQSVPVIGGVPNALSGVPNALSGYRVNGYTSNGSGAGSVMGSAMDTRCGSGYMN